MSQGSTPEADEYRIRSAQNWEAAAGAWEENRDYTRATFAALTGWMRDHLALAPGQTVLELAGGPGDTAVELAPAVAPGGRYIVTDRAEAMVVAQRRAADAAGLGDVIDPRVIDAEQIDLPDASVDAVACRFGLMLIPDQRAVARETQRVLRPGGRCCFVVWSTEETNPWASRLWGVFERLMDIPASPPGSPGMFALADQAELSALLTDAGLERNAIETIDVTWRYGSFDDYWTRVSAMSGGVARALTTMSVEQRDELISSVRAAMDEFGTADGGYALPGQAVAVAATR